MRVQGDPALGSMRVESAPALVRQRIIRLLVNLRSSRLLWSAPSQSHALPLILVRRCLALLVLHAHRNAVARPLEPLSFSVHHAPPAPPPPEKNWRPCPPKQNHHQTRLRGAIMRGIDKIHAPQYYMHPSFLISATRVFAQAHQTRRLRFNNPPPHTPPCVSLTHVSLSRKGRVHSARKGVHTSQARLSRFTRRYCRTRAKTQPHLKLRQSAQTDGSAD